MGYRLVEEAFAFVSAHNKRARAENDRQLGPLEVAVLVRMAQRARDDDPQPTYSEHRAALLDALGIEDDNNKSGRARVQRALSALIAADAVGAPSRAHRGLTPRYSLSYQGGHQWPPYDEEGGHQWPPYDEEGGHQRPERGPTMAPGVTRNNTPARAPAHAHTRAHARETLDPIPTTGERSPKPYPAQCDDHQHGPHTAPCAACGAARVADRAASRGARAAKRAASRRTYRVVNGRRVCDNQPHQLAGDGSCVYCEIRADDAAASLIEIGIPA
ncbi:hypothetical protein [Microbacterium sp.]|uniref:hypothetical protein n=1 Tax=Microbacterium sp. TaxID=51671 RepID=UPI0039E53B64